MPESFFSQLRQRPEVQDLIKNVGAFTAARVAQGVGGNSDGGAAEGAAGGIAEAVSEDRSPILGGITGAIKGFFSRRGTGSKRPTNIYEQNFIGVPVEVAYASWKDYAEFPKFMKGPESVSEEDEDGKTKWTAKIFINRRSWTATVVEDIENYKIRWETEAPKGTIDGTVTFHPVSENLTLMVYVLEYRPKGFFERIGNLNRVVGRRARLDAKHFARYVMMQEQQGDDDEEAQEDSADVARSPESADEDVEPGDESDQGEEEDPPEEDDVTPEEPKPVKRPDREPRRPRNPRSPRG